jgi:transcriptional regulator with XRE-family HTH domain
MNNLRYYRKLRGLTQLELAEISGITRYTISRIENYKNVISTPTLLALSKALSIDTQNLIGGNVNENR